MAEFLESFRPSRRSVLAGMAAAAGATALSWAGGVPAWGETRAPLHTRQRERTLLNADWSFYRGEIGNGAAPSLDVAGWAAVSLPHTWNDADTLDDERGYYRGPGWYRRSLEIPNGDPKKRLFLYFEGANQVADVYVEGQRVGGHVGGYQAFSVEITEQVRHLPPGSPATVAVRVDNSHSDDIAPLSGDFTFYGGIYRNVWLVVTDQVHIDLLDHASSGVYVTTPQVSAASAIVAVRTRVVNQSTKDESIRLSHDIYDAAGRVVSSTRLRVKLAAGEVRELQQELPAIARPSLWSPEAPNLYSVSTVVANDGAGKADRVDVPLGFRWYSYDAASGFSLNGAPYPLRGVNRHQDIVGKGNALTDEEHYRDVQIIREMGANVLRLAHYPQAPAVLEAADELGLILWEEAPLVNAVTPTEAFRTNSLTMQREMIRQHFNHPSVIFWGYMNEILLMGPRPQPAGYQEYLVALTRELEALTRAEDPQRITVMAMNRDTADRYNTWGLADIPMVAAWNLYWGWYYGYLAGFAEFLDDQHSRFPNRALWVSEYGADTDSRLHWKNAEDLPVNPSTGRVSYQEQSAEFGQLFNETYINAINERPWLVGTTLWAQFEFGSENRTGTIPHVNQKGIMHFDRTPKDVVHLYRSHWLPNPVLQIASREWNHRVGNASAGSSTATQPVKVYSNLEQVELLINDVSLGVKAPGAGRTVTWDVPFKNGVNKLTAKSRDPRHSQVRDDVEVQFSLIPFPLASGAPTFSRLAVNAGGIVQYIDPNQLVWAEDQDYQTGGWGAVGGTSGWISNAWINKSPEDPLYQTYRSGMSAYRFDVPPGNYEVFLRFAEPSANAAGARVFNVRLNDTPLVTSLDLFATAGRTTAHDVRGSVSVAPGGSLTAYFDKLVGDPVVSGIEVRRLAG
jgi:beta-galactosidase